MNQKHLVSTILLFSDGPEAFIREAVDSVIAQTYDNWEILLVDDGQMGTYSKIIRQQAKQNAQKFRYFESDYRQCQSPGSPRNFAITRAEGDYVAFLRADDVWSSHKLEKQINIFNSHPETDMLYGMSQYWWGWTGNPQDRVRDRIQEHGIQADALFEPPTLLKLFLQGKLLVPNISSILIRREMLERIGGFEDADFGVEHLYDDQVLFSKAYLQARIFVSSQCWDKYRQYSDSRSTGGINQEQDRAARRMFLRWLADYLSERGHRNTEVWHALNFERMLHRHWGIGRRIKRAQRFIWRRQGTYPLCIKK